LYLNYDCAEDARVNVFQRVAEILCKLGGSHVAPPPKGSPHHWLASVSDSSTEGAAAVAAAWRAVQQRPTVFNTPLAQSTLPLPHAPRLRGASAEHHRPLRTYSVSSQSTAGAALQSSAATAMLYGGLGFGGATDRGTAAALAVDDYMVRQWALEALSVMLQSMVAWSDRLAGASSGLPPPVPAKANAAAEASEEEAATKILANGNPTDPTTISSPAPTPPPTVAGDDPQELSSIKQRKEQYETGRKLFAWKPKKGIEAWRAGGFLKSNDPVEVGRFLFAQSGQGIDKLQLGEYLGEGDAHNIAVMHAFVDSMDFGSMDFVDALRLFLQSFRLPGEAQKIDRYMLKFAERYSISARAFFRPPANGTPARSSSNSAHSLVPTVSVAELAKLETNSQALVVMVDRLFTASVHLSGSGIVAFVGALSRVAWGEITATFSAANGGDLGDAGQLRHPHRHSRRGSAQAHGLTAAPSRLFSLTKIVEIAYYNMERIRVEWSQIWAVLGPLFDRVGAYSDTRAALFALDSLRQLSMKFLEKEELPHFAFQKEFLRPFADILEGYVPEPSPSPPALTKGPQRRSTVVAVDVLVKDMVLRCVHQIVQAAARHIRSGWKAILNVAQIAARDANDSIAEMGFHIAKACAEQHGPQMWMLTTVRVQQASQDTSVDVVSVAGIEYFHELIDCLNEFAVGAAARRPRLALSAIDVLYGAGVALGRQVLSHPAYAPNDGISLDDQPLYRVWMPVLRALHEVVMHTEDLEVRTRALDAFFRLVMAQGQHFLSGLWAGVLRDLVFSMFADLRDPSASRRFATVDDLELWFSTTLIKALRHLIALFSRYYPTHLSNAMMAEVLELLVMCIAQPSEILGKIGTSCLQDLVRSNYAKWDDDAWSMVCATLARLFNWSQPRELFTIAGAEYDADQHEQQQQQASTNGNALLPAIAPVAVKRTPSTQPHAANRPSPLRTGGSAASLLSSTDGNETPSPSTTPSTPTRTPVVDDDKSNSDSPMPAISSSANSLARASVATAATPAESKPDYMHITLKCILQLLLIQTLGELFGANVESADTSAGEPQATGDDLYCHMSAHHLFILLDCLDQSRAFAHRFNMSRRVRRRLVEMGVMPTMPSLLKQETSSVLVELHILQRMHSDAMGVSYALKRKQDSVSKTVIAERQAVAVEVDDRLAMLMRTVFVQYSSASNNVSRTHDATADDDAAALDSTKSKRIVKLVSNKTTSDLSSVEAKRGLVVTSSWRGSLVTILGHIADLSKSNDATKPFNAAVSRHWPELVDMLGVAAAVRDFDIVGGIQRVLALAG
ncbi:guanine nucleotide exchange protein for ADP-robosylation factor, partial [Coemansia sp. RSA 2320]